MAMQRPPFVSWIAGLLLGFALAMSAPATAQQQPSIVNPSAQAVKEGELLRELQRIQGRTSLPDPKAGMLEQPEGRQWREFHQVTMKWVGAIAILGMLAAIVIFYLTRGMVRIGAGRSGRTITRFSGFERFVHWMTAVCFVVLAISGLNMTFGRDLLAPLIGLDAFASWSQWAKYAHNYLSFPFTLGVALIFLMWLAGNLPSRGDLTWVKQGGGILGNDHPPAKRFNPGQKLIYWVVVLGGGASAITGYLLMFPFYGTTLSDMQTAQMVHGIVGLLFIAIMLAHIYIGTIGMQGAFEAMGSGEVDENWARQHHSLWLEKERLKGRVSGRPAPAE